MKYFDIKHRNAPLQIACLWVFLLGLIIYLIVPSLYASSNIWRGYYTVLIDEGVPWRELYRVLDAGRLDYIAPNNTPVYVSTFDSLDEVELSRIPERLEESDPRLDLYIRNLPNYFSASSSINFLSFEKFNGLDAESMSAYERKITQNGEL